MDPRLDSLDISILLEPPHYETPSEILAAITLSCAELGLTHSGDLLPVLLSRAERQALRWYLEEYWKWPYLEFAERGKEVEDLLYDVGKRLYRSVFGSVEAQQTIQAWLQQPAIRHQVSIESSISPVLSMPWELLHDDENFLVLSPDHPVSIVRRLPEEAHAASTRTFEPPLRILLVTARPTGTGFIDPRSIARELLDELQPQIENGAVEIEFLRPPTIKALSARLHDPVRPPIHVLHFDGHGVFDEEMGGQGVLLFETEAGKLSIVEARNMAKVLRDSGIQLVVLTACQSALGKSDDAFSSVAAQLIGSGIDAVIAMSASVLVTSTARYVEAFYRELASGTAVPLAQERARQALYDDPRRHTHYHQKSEEGQWVELRDWWLPHFYQQHPLDLRPSRPSGLLKLDAPSSRHRMGVNMPAEPHYGFSGRSQELFQIERWLMQQRLVMVYGFGGVGKTALVREAANWLTRTEMYESACFVSFEHGGDSSWLFSMLGNHLGIYDAAYNPGDRDAALERLAPVLKERRTLVLADNLESMFSSVDADEDAQLQLRDALVALTKLGAGVLLTSRGILFVVDALLPTTRVASLRLDVLEPEDAYALAARMLAELGIDRSSIPYAELQDLLQQLDYHPLAIQLVLPRLPTIPLPQLRSDFAALLSQFSDDNETGRNRSLLASLEYSLRQLSEEQRKLLSTLAIFEGRACEDDLLQVTGISSDEWAGLRTMLEKAGLVTTDQLYKTARARFLRFHPTLIPYLRNQLTVETDQHEVRQRYVQQYYENAHMFYDRDAALPEIRAWVRWDLANFIHAFDLLLASQMLTGVFELAAILMHFLDVLGLVRERDAIQKKLEKFTSVSDASASSPISWIDWLRETSIANSDFKQGNFHTAIDRFTSLLQRMDQLPAQTRLGRGSADYALTLRLLSLSLIESGQLTEAREPLTKALDITTTLLEQDPENIDVKREAFRGALQLGNLLSLQGRYEEAKGVYEVVVNAGVIDDDLTTAYEIVVQRGIVELQLREYEEAKRFFESALTYLEQLNEPDLTRESGVWRLLGMVARYQQHWEEAERHFRKSLELGEILKNTMEVANTCNALGSMAVDMGRFDQAEKWYKQALSNIEHLPPSRMHEAVLKNLTRALYHQLHYGLPTAERIAEALSYGERARTIDEATQSEPDEQLAGFIDALKAMFPFEDGELTEAEYQHEITICEREYRSYEYGPCYERLVRLKTRMDALPAGGVLGRGSRNYAWVLARIAGCLSEMGQATPAEQLLQDALTVIDEVLEQTPDDQEAARQRGVFLGELGNVLLNRGLYIQAQEWYTQALQVAEMQKDRRAEAVALGQLGRVVLRQGDRETAKTHYNRSLELFRAVGDMQAEVGIWYQLGRIAQEQHDWSAAEQAYRASLAIEEQYGDKIVVASACNQLAFVAKEAGNFAAALGWQRRGVALVGEVQPGTSLHAGYLNNLASTLVDGVQGGHLSRNSLDEAKELAQRAVEVYAGIDLSAKSWAPYGTLAEIAVLEGRSEEARSYRRREREVYQAFPANFAEIDRQYGEIIAAVVAGTQGNEQMRQLAILLLERSEQNLTTQHLATAMHRIWAGERDLNSLAEDLNGAAAFFVQRVLEALAQPLTSQQEAIATLRGVPAAELIQVLSLPHSVLIALASNDHAALEQALAALPVEEQERVRNLLPPAQGSESARDTKMVFSDYQQVIEYTDRLLSENSEDVDAYAARAYAYGELGQHDRALEDYSRAIELGTTDNAAYFQRGSIYYRLHDYEKALADFDHTLSLASDDPSALAARGSAHYQLQHYQSALEDFNRALALQTADAEIYVKRGLAFEKLKQYEQAIADYKRSLALDPGSVSPYHFLARIYSSLGDYQQAIDAYTHILALEPEDHETYFQRGTSHYMQQEYEQALADLNRAIALNPTHAEAYVNRSAVFYALQNYQQVVEDCSQAIALLPDDPDAFRNRGLAHMKLQQYEQAEADFRRTLVLNPTDDEAWLQSGHIYKYKGEYQAAADAYEQAAALNPQQSAIYSHLGEVSIYLEAYEQAITSLSRSIELDSSDPFVYSNRGLTYSYMGAYEQAVADLDRALELAPDISSFYYNRGLIHARQEHYQQALEDFGQAIDLDPEDASHYVERATTYLHLGQLEQARADFRQVGNLDPANLYAAWMILRTTFADTRPSVGMADLLTTLAARYPEQDEANLCRAVALFLRNEPGAALGEIEQYLNRKPSASDGYFWLGMLYALFYPEQDEQAVKYFEQAVELGLPRALLAPLHWLEQDLPDFYAHYARKLLLAPRPGEPAADAS